RGGRPYRGGLLGACGACKHQGGDNREEGDAHDHGSHEFPLRAEGGITLRPLHACGPWHGDERTAEGARRADGRRRTCRSCVSPEFRFGEVELRREGEACVPGGATARRTSYPSP